MSQPPIDQQSTTHPPASRNPRGRRWLRRGFFAIVVVFVLLAVVPYIMASGLFRDQVLNAALNSQESRVAAQAAHFGWFSPLEIEGLQIESPQQRLRVNVARISADRPWVQLWAAPETLGHFRIVQPQVHFDLNWQDFGGDSTPAIPELSATVRDAGVTVDLKHAEEPVIHIGGLNLDVSIERQEDGRWLSVESGKVFADRHLTPEMCSQLLQLMDPLLGEVLYVEGAFSLQVERLRLSKVGFSD